MSKTIDVEAGDEFVVSENGTISVRRNGLWRWFLYPHPCVRQNYTMPGDRKITAEQAIAVAKALGYNVTQPEPKGEKAANVTVSSGARETPASMRDNPVPATGVEQAWAEARVMAEILAKEEAAFAKPDPTPDVPVVDAVWVEYTIGKGPDAATCLAPYSNEKSARACNTPDFNNGTARIVRLAEMGVDMTARQDAVEALDMTEDLAATVKRLEGRVNDLTKIVHGLQASMPGYDKDVSADEAFRRLDDRVAKLEAVIAEAQSLLNESPKAATTPAKVRVVAPMPIASPASSYGNGYNDAIADFTKVLSAAGIDVVKEVGK